MKPFITFFTLMGLLSSPATTSAESLVINKGDRICLIGNTLPERMQHFGYFETLLHSRFPAHELVVRNLGFSADELTLRSRSLNFGDPDHHLRKEKADVVLAFFGFNESFDGEEGLETFHAELDTFVAETLSKNYSGKAAPRLALISPIACEDIGGSLPSAAETNRRIERYAATMAEIAAKHKVPFVDLYGPTLSLLSPKENLTINGIHLSEAGYKHLAPILDQGLFGPESAVTKFADSLREAINDKNFHYFHRYRAVNGYYIYGGRSQLRFDPDRSFTNADVMERERTVLDEMCANRDQRIWAAAQGKDVSGPIDDSQVSPFIDVKSNFGSGSNDGKEGSIAYLTPQESLEKMQLGRGYEANVFASEVEFPELANCVQMTFDSSGRLWVCTMPMYQGIKPKQPMTDKIVVLEDTDGDGKADKSTIFADDLHVPTGLEVGDGGVYVAQQPDVMFLRDTDGDGKADVRERILHGFDSADSHHSISTFTWGPGGALYMHEGTFHHTSVETPYGPVRNAHGGIYRYDAKRKKLETFVSYNFANPWGQCFDEWGQNFVADASGGANYWGTAFSGRPVPYEGQDDFGPFKFTYRAELKQFIEKRVRPTAGCEIVSSHHFPPSAQGNFLLNNCIGFLGVLQHKIYDDGAGFRGQEIDPILQSFDGNFRPVDLEFGPDGALYVVDWHNALVGHMQHNVRDPNRDKTHGRIWRITYPSRSLARPPKIAGEPIANLLELLKDPILRTRHHVRMELRLHPTKEVVKQLAAWIERLDPQDDRYEHHLLEALWVHQHHDSVSQSLLEKILNAKDPRARAAATRVVGYWHDRLGKSLDLLAKSVADDHPRVRAEAVRALSFVDSRQSASIALDVLNKSADDYIKYILTETLRVLAPHLAITEATTQRSRPGVMLDKSDATVWFQLNALSDQDLLALERDITNPRYELVYEAILKRHNTPETERLAAVEALARLNKTDAVQELARIVRALDLQKADSRSQFEIGKFLLSQPHHLILEQRTQFETLAENGKTATGRQIGYGVLMNHGFVSAASRTAKRKGNGGLKDMLSAINMVNNSSSLEELYGLATPLLQAQDAGVQSAAIAASTAFKGKEAETFKQLTALMDGDASKHALVQALHRLPTDHWDNAALPKLANSLVEFAYSIPSSERNEAAFLDTIQLGSAIADQLSGDAANGLRESLSQLQVPVIRIGTIKHQLKFDKTSFTVKAGKEIELVFENTDILPHNLLLAKPGALEEVGDLADKMALQADGMAKHFIPDSPKVLLSTKLLPEGKSEALKFTAPKEAGETLYICTFPGHWRTMHGTMHVKD